MVLGRTGSGKTYFGANLLSMQNFDQMPWTIIDYKGDALIQSIRTQNKLKEIHPKDKPPTRPGLYIMQPRPKLDDKALEEWLMKVWENEDHGLYIDEGYALPQKDAFDIILTQGRAKHIPVIVLYQRPVYMSRFATAQADYFAVFAQHDRRDLKTTNEFVGEYTPIRHRGEPRPQTITVYEPLPKFHCYWRDVAEGTISVLSPVPGKNTILAQFRNRLDPRSSRGLRSERLILQ